MKRPKTLTPWQYLIVLHNLFATAAAMVEIFYVHFEDYRCEAQLPWLETFLPTFPA